AAVGNPSKFGTSITIWAKIQFLLFGRVGGKRNNHFFQRYTAVLECFVEIIDKVVVIVGIYKICVLARKDEAGADMQLWQHSGVRIFYMEYVFGDAIKVLALFIAQDRIGVAVADYLAGMLYTDGAVVGGDNQSDLLLRKPPQRFEQRRVFKPRKGK